MEERVRKDRSWKRNSKEKETFIKMELLPTAGLFLFIKNNKMVSKICACYGDFFFLQTLYGGEYYTRNLNGVVNIVHKNVKNGINEGSCAYHNLKFLSVLLINFKLVLETEEKVRPKEKLLGIVVVRQILIFKLVRTFN